MSTSSPAFAGLSASNASVLRSVCVPSSAMLTSASAGMGTPAAAESSNVNASPSSQSRPSSILPTPQPSSGVMIAGTGL